MLRRWMVLGLGLSSLVSLADGTEGVPPLDWYSPQQELRVAVTDGGLPGSPTRFAYASRGTPRAILLYVSEVRTPGAVMLRLEEDQGVPAAVATTTVTTPGWHEWQLPPPLRNFRYFTIETASADVTFRFALFNYEYRFPSSSFWLGHVETGGVACTGILRLTGAARPTGCNPPDDDQVTGLPYVDTRPVSAGLHQQRLRLHADFFEYDNPVTLGWEGITPTPRRVIGFDGRAQEHDDAGYFAYAVTDRLDGGMTSPFVVEFESDGGNVLAAYSYPPSACHPAARAGLDGDESRWVGGPMGSDLVFRASRIITWRHYLDLDGDGVAGSTFEWRYDGQQVAPSDCDDANPARRPGAPERCNAIDDDCDGTVDGPNLVLDRCERTAGICTPIRHRRADCQNGAWQTCESQGHYPTAFSPEELRCDGVDEDCDGTVDDAPPPVSCPLTQGVCAGSRTQTCSAASWAACTYGSGYELTESSCDGLDNDCDGLLDAADLDVPQSACELQQGVCANAVHARAGCTATGWASCTRTEYGTNFQQDESRCDGLDNDCDGLTDADDPDLDDAPCEQQLGVCAGLKHVRAECGASGWRACAPERHPTTWEASETRCDGLDNDCDGVTDEGCRAMPPTIAPRPTTQGCTCASAGGLEWMLVLLVIARAARPRRARTDRRVSGS